MITNEVVTVVARTAEQYAGSHWINVAITLVAMMVILAATIISIRVSMAKDKTDEISAALAIGGIFLLMTLWTLAYNLSCAIYPAYSMALYQ